MYYVYVERDFILLPSELKNLQLIPEATQASFVYLIDLTTFVKNFLPMAAILGIYLARKTADRWYQRESLVTRFAFGLLATKSFTNSFTDVIDSNDLKYACYFATCIYNGKLLIRYEFCFLLVSFWWPEYVANSLNCNLQF